MHAAAAFGGYSIFLPQLNRGADHKQTNGNIDAFPWGAWPRDAAVTRTSKQAGKALRSQGHHYARVM